jgi:hypothetical protein
MNEDRMDEQSLWSRTLQEAAIQRQRHLTGEHLLSRDGTTEELTSMGLMRWYLHPNLENSSTNSLYVHELEIPVGSWSGKLQCQGGVIHFVLDGVGRTTVDGISHSWAPDDVIALPIRESGIVYQHLNTGEVPVRLLVVSPNLDSALGPEGGVEMEVLEVCPEYAKRVSESESR